MLTLADQLESQISLGYPALAGLTDEAYRELAEPAIAAMTQDLVPSPESAGPGVGHVPALLVVTRLLVPDEARVPMLRLAGSEREGILDRNHFSDARKGLEHYLPVPELEVPEVPFYVVLDVDRGDEFRSVPPIEAVAALTERGRTPLTIDEGLSLAAAFPASLQKNHCYMLAGSSRGDRRMLALWISGRAPKLGWCFAGNPHTWLGVASAGGRVAPALAAL